MKLQVGNVQTARVALFSLALLVCLACYVSAQTTTTKPLPPPPRTTDPITASQSSSDDRAPVTSFEEEIRAKRAIKIAEKEYQENLNRAKEIADLGRQLGQTLKNKSAVERDDAKKLDRLDRRGVEAAYTSRIALLFQNWMTDTGPESQTRARKGYVNARKIYIEVMTNIDARDPEGKEP